MIQPPKMSPFWFASAGIGITRSAGIFPSGSLSTTLQEMQRSAAERGEAGAENQAGVHQVRVGDDPFGEHGLRFLQVRLDQRVDQFLVVLAGLAFLRFSIHPAV